MSQTLADNLLELLETQLDPEPTHTACRFNTGDSLLLLSDQALPHLPPQLATPSRSLTPRKSQGPSCSFSNVPNTSPLQVFALVVSSESMLCPQILA